MRSLGNIQPSVECFDGLTTIVSETNPLARICVSALTPFVSGVVVSP
jgi:hypothetical protein